MLGVTLLVLALYVGGLAGEALLAFGAGGAAIAGITLAIQLPRQRRLLDVKRVAAALADLRFDERTPGARGELGPVSSALNAASLKIGRLVGTLRQELAQLDALLNASSDATVAVDGAGRVTYMNDAAGLLFEPADRESMGRPFIEAVRDHDLNGLLMAAVQRGERGVRVVVYGPSQRWLQATAVPIEGGGAWAALAVFHDLTEVRRLDSVRRDFISNVSHELRTPLAGIRAAAETLQEGAIDDRPAAIEFMGHILRETDRLTQLVEELLELSRIESGAAPMTFSRIDVSALVRATASRFAQQAERAGLKLATDVPETALEVFGDSEQLERALANLVANAIKFTDAGGGVTLRACLDGDHVALSVIDTGVGIELDQQARVFERFFKGDRGRAAGGTGLGLAIVKHIVLAHGGTVAVESRPGRGATFTMRLPQR